MQPSIRRACRANCGRCSRARASRAPYVVAGHGLGAAFAAAFAALYPISTAAVVLLDAPKPNHPSADRAILGPMPEAMPWLARVGVTRLMNATHAGRDARPGALGRSCTGRII